MMMLAVFGGERWAFACALLATASRTYWWLYWRRRARPLLAQVSTLPAVQQRAWELAVLAAEPRLVGWLRDRWQPAIRVLRAFFQR
jgi:hypothetical protein